MASFIESALRAVNSVFNALGSYCSFTLSCGGDAVIFPVTPGSFEVSQKFNNSTITINSIGEINMLGKQGLRAVKFQAFFPNNDYDFAMNYSMSPYGYVEKIAQMAKAGQPCRINITGTAISMPCTIDDFSYSEKDGTGDVYFSIELKEYRYVRPDSDLINDVTGLKSRTEEAEKARNVTAYSTDAMESAQKAVQKIQKVTKTAGYARRQIETYKAIVKSGGITAGDVLTITASEVMKNGQLIKRFGD